MEGDHMCPTHKKRCVEREEENYFFALSKYQSQIQVCPYSNSLHTSVCGLLTTPGLPDASFLFALMQSLYFSIGAAQTQVPALHRAILTQ